MEKPGNRGYTLEFPKGHPKHVHMSYIVCGPHDKAPTVGNFFRTRAKPKSSIQGAERGSGGLPPARWRVPVQP